LYGEVSSIRNVTLIANHARISLSNYKACAIFPERENVLIKEIQKNHVIIKGVEEYSIPE